MKRKYNRLDFLSCTSSCRSSQQTHTHTMEADVLAALKTKAAYLSGSRDLPIIIVKTPTAELKSTWKKQPLELCLQYLLNSLRYDTLTFRHTFFLFFLRLTKNTLYFNKNDLFD